MARDFSSTVKIRVPFSGYVDFEVDVTKSDKEREFADAKQIVLMNCSIQTDEKGVLNVYYPPEGDIRVNDFGLKKTLDVDNATEW